MSHGFVDTLLTPFGHDAYIIFEPVKKKKSAIINLRDMYGYEDIAGFSNDPIKLISFEVEAM